MNTIAHYTLNTGDLRRSPRSEVGQLVLRHIAANLKPQGPHTASYAPPNLSVSVGLWHPPGRALFAFGLNGGLVCAAALQYTTGSPSMEAQEGKMTEALLSEARRYLSEPLPWLVVMLFPEIVRLPKAEIELLGDLERCLAWHIISQAGF